MQQVYSADALLKARKLQRRRKFQGLEISIETRSGAFRHWYDPHVGKEGKTRMPHDYGYIRGTMGADGDHIDCYIGPDPNATHAYVVDQMKAPDFQVFDEQKVFLGFDSAMSARRAYMTCYDKPGFFGRIKAVPMGEFRKQALATTKLDPLVKHEGPVKQRARPVDAHAPKLGISVPLRKAGYGACPECGVEDADGSYRTRGGQWSKTICGACGHSAMSSTWGKQLRKAARKRLGLRRDLPHP